MSTPPSVLLTNLHTHPRSTLSSTASSTQSVLVRQLERELASTVAALRDERRERRVQTEALRAKIDETGGTIREREVELER